MSRSIVLAVLVPILVPVSAWAQAPGPTGKYQPSRPTISPYLNLLRRNPSPVPNYYSLVRPQLQQLDVNRRQQAVNLHQQGQLRTLDRQVLSITESPAASTGTGAVFRNYSHYYNLAPIPPR